MHCPQNILAETELRNLAAIPYQIISPASNSPIIGIYQDSLLGAYRLTRENIKFTPREAMNLLMMYNNVNTDEIRKLGNNISSFDVLSQILSPITLSYNTKLFDEKVDDKKTSNNVLEIRNGKYIRGQIEKSVLGSSTKGILHRIFNDYGNMACSNFIDNIQYIVTEYMKTSSFSVGISDLIANEDTKKKIIQVIMDQKLKVQEFIDKVHLGTFENTTANTNMTEFEINVNNILNDATQESGKIGRTSLSKDNRFVMIVNSGSKGTVINIAQMISCLGQQNVDGKRIPYGFDSRTLPHYTKYDDSPNPRGFIENSYITGLSAPDLFFHAMGGRIGLIDTAVKSVTWETPIVIIENNKCVYTEIGHWIDNILDNKENKNMIQNYPNDRNMELMNVNNVYIPTTNDDGIVTWGELTAVTRHDPGNKLYKITTLGGRSVTVPESKSLLVWKKDSKQFIEKLTPEINIGDFMPTTEILIDSPIEINYVNMENYLPKTEYIYGTDFNIAKNAMIEAMKDREHIYPRWWNSNNGKTFTLPYTKKSSLQRTLTRSNINNILNGYIYPYHAKRIETYIPEKFDLNEENGIFIGLFLAEGNVHNEHIYITNNDINVRLFTKKWFDSNGIHYKEYQRVNKIGGTTTSIVGNSEVLSQFLDKFVGSGAENKYVPNEAYIANKSFILGFNLYI